MASSAHEEHMNALLRYGIQRSNRYEVTIPLPKSLGGTSSSSASGRTSQSGQHSLFGYDTSIDIFGFKIDVLDSITSIVSNRAGDQVRGLSLMCEQTEIPGKSFSTTDVKYNGDYFRMPYSNVYGLHSFTFNVSQDGYEKAITDKWMDTVINIGTQEIGYYDDYTTDVTISLLDTQDHKSYSVRLIDAYPVFSNPITVNQSENNTVALLMVQFAYRKWEIVGSESNSGLASSLSETPFGKYLTPILSNPVVKQATSVLKQNGIDLEGDAVQYYNMADSIVKGTTGSSINKSTTLLNGMINQVQSDHKINANQTAKVISMLRNTIGTLGGN